MTENNLIVSGNNDIIDKLFYPYLFKVSKFIPKWVTPNQLTVFAFLCGLMTSIELLFVKEKYAFILAALFLFLQYFFDSLDGMHARNTGQGSLFGGFFDHFCDVLFLTSLHFAILIRFDMLSPFYVFLFLMMMCCYALIYLSYATTGTLYLPLLGGGFQSFVIMLIFIASYFFEININLYHYFEGQNICSALHISCQSMNSFKIIAFLYVITIPSFLVDIFLRTKKSLKNKME